VQVTAYGRQTVPDLGVVRSCDPLQSFGAPIISLERLNLKSSNFAHEKAISILCNRMTHHQQKGVVMVTFAVSRDAVRRAGLSATTELLVDRCRRHPQSI